MLEFVHEMVRRRARGQAQACAILDCDGKETSYGELAELASRAAGALRHFTGGAQTPVAVQAVRSPALIATMLAVFEAGCVYAPVDDSAPPARLAAMIANLRASVLITAPGSGPPPGLPPGLRAVTLAGLSAGSPEQRSPRLAGPEGPASSLRPDSLAYVLYTSGSTSTPKGVAMTHRGLSRLITWQLDDGPAGLTTLSFTAPAFDVTFQEVLSTLASGGRLVLVGEQARRDPARLLAVIAEESVERLFLPYVALQQLAVTARGSGQVPRSLRQVITAGERLVITDAISWLFGRIPQCRLDNHYGPTETHLVTSFTLRGADRPWPAHPPVGRPVSGAEVYVLDSVLAVVPPGSTGELYVTGPAVARGYRDDPAQTAERFVADPFRGAGARMYRTGDLARADSDGLIHFAGRADDQLKVRGYRIEPAEVELALARHPAVREVAVGSREIGRDLAGLVAYLVADGAEVSPADLLAFLRPVLPGYLIPDRFVFLDALPLTSTGKADRRALAGYPLPAEPPVSTGTGTAGEIVSAVWQRVLGHDEFDADDDFFDVGGDSKLAALVVAELGEVLGRELELALLLRDSTVAGLAARISELSEPVAAKAGGSAIETLRPGPSGRIVFLVHPLGGELIGYRELAREMTAPVSVLGVGWNGPADGIPASVPELAAVHLRTIRSRQPHGPYWLGGWSFGGVLAFELACQLRTAGDQVEFLGLVDANPLLDPISGEPPASTPYLDLLTRVLDRIDRSDRSDQAGQAAVDLSGLAGEGAWTDLMGFASPDGLTARHLRRQVQVAHRNMRALVAYQPGHYPGDVHLFQAARTRPEIQRELAASVRRVVGGAVSTYQVPGNHSALLAPPGVSVLAAVLDRALQNIAIAKAGEHDES